MSRWDQLDDIISRVEKILVVFLLSLMILVAFLQIVLRNFFATGLSWGDELVRYLVLWVGFIGAAMATKEGKHIAIEVFSRWVCGRGEIYLSGISHFCSLCICGLLTYAAIKFINFEVQMESTSFLGIPAWILEFIIPMTFGLMTFRFALRFFKELANILTPDLDPELDKEL